MHSCQEEYNRQRSTHGNIFPPRLPHYHDSEDVLRPGLVVQPVCGVDDPRTRIDPEQSHTGRVYASVDGEAETGTLVHVWSSNPQQLRVDRHVLRDADIISRLWEDWGIVVAVLDADEHLSDKETGAESERSKVGTE